MLNIALCEDCQIQAKEILTLLNAYSDMRPGIIVKYNSFDSCIALLESVDTGTVYDMFLLDILMPGMNGIELARELRARDENTPLVFITSSADFSLEAFNVSATHYILKPAGQDTLFPVLDKVIAMQKREDERFILISTPESTVKILFSSIICVELSKRALRVILDSGDSLSSKTIREPFASAIAPLLRDSRFLYAHKSYILNMALVRELTGNSFVMKDGTVVPVPRSKYAEAKKKYFDYLSARGIGLLGGNQT